MKNSYLASIALLLAMQFAHGHGPKPGPLMGLPLPDVPGLLDGSDPIVINKERAIALGKALFWDINVGSDGMACGSCHFHAGADVRVKNQVDPGLKAHTATGLTFSTLGSGDGGPNHSLTKQDFPLHERTNPFDRNATAIRDTDDVIASSGTFSGEFRGASRFTGSSDVCSRDADDVFNVGHTNTRRVEPRNAPTVINTIFTFRNFWDGRANNVYNGVSLWGDRDPDAGIWVRTGARSIAKQRLRLENASLASLAMAPPFSDTEMACRQRRWADIGRKLLSRPPLQHQKVHHQDSVFGPLGLTNSTASAQLPGLKTTYRTLVTQAFNPKYWSFSTAGVRGFPAPRPGEAPFSQAEVNFSLFFGIALQMYQATLVSDQAPIDQVPRVLTTGGTYLNPRWNLLYPNDLQRAARLTNGFNVFMANHCSTCHAGPLATSAAIVPYSMVMKPVAGAFYGPEVSRIPFGLNALGPFRGGHVAGLTEFANVVTRDLTVTLPPNSARFRDIDFANTGVTHPDNDRGLMDVDDFGNPLSFSYQYQQYLAGYTQNVVDSVVYRIRACDFIAHLVDPSGSTTPDTEYFNDADQLEVDGVRDGVNKSTGCIVSDLTGETNVPKIPTVAAARAALGMQKMAIGDKAAFKIPTLRNVELTGPFMHNGGMATLEQVVEFYARKGNFINENQHHFLDGINLVGNALPLGSDLSSQRNRADLVEFLKSLTDDRVRFERAPFDHPEIAIPHGHKGNTQSVESGNPVDSKLAADDMLVIPAVGAGGAVESDGVTPKALLPFDRHLPDAN
ncbi:MAG: cytochrome C peroxidase [Methylomonas sp.]|nr:cytochrome C peroxidase [Methylomonas sp.]PPD21661.1 MAG: cytochrome C peroxidase [Methylomonas sp.]PPD25958.1 MAG: cytochrome C peroxidase [Methylomonas sp.]PPD37694.1 MAG: cytochrome C peroxidase [Methylomonas sp.]PPD39301.1 MAG: cytochrome C peroxidase [Methylomonas sp.]